MVFLNYGGRLARTQWKALKWVNGLERLKVEMGRQGSSPERGADTVLCSRGGELCGQTLTEQEGREGDCWFWVGDRSTLRLTHGLGKPRGVLFREHIVVWVLY